MTLHVPRATGLGKHRMVKNIGPRFPRLQAALEAELGADRSVFMCMHKEAKHVALNYETHFARSRSDIGARSMAAPDIIRYG